MQHALQDISRFNDLPLYLEHHGERYTTTIPMYLDSGMRNVAATVSLEIDEGNLVMQVYSEDRTLTESVVEIPPNVNDILSDPLLFISYDQDGNMYLSGIGTGSGSDEEIVRLEEKKWPYLELVVDNTVKKKAGRREEDDTASVESVHISVLRNFHGRKITPEDERELCERRDAYKASGDTTKYVDTVNELTLFAGRLIMKIANQHRHKGIDLVDLVQVGSIGAHKAAKKYDFRKNAFIPYARWWIERDIKREFMQNKDIGMSESLQYKMGRQVRFTNRYLSEHGHLPTMEERAEFIGVTVKELEEMMVSDLEVKSLDNPVKKGNGTIALIDEIPSTQFEGYAHVPESMDDYVQRSQLRDALEKALSKLSPKQREAIDELYLKDGTEPSAAEVGRRLNIARQAVKDRENTSFKKLREEDVLDSLRPFL